MELRKCKCGTVANTVEELELFEKSKPAKHGRLNRCKKCSQKKTRKSEKNNRGRYLMEKKKWSTKNRYGITVEEYDECIASSDVCEICGVIPQQKHYDHNHSLPKNIEAFRGVLCNKCNTGLGLFKDNKDLLLKAYGYLEERGSYGEY